LVDPVSTVDGQIYSRSAIELWFSMGHRTSPATGDTLKSLALTPIYVMKRLLEQAVPATGAIAATGATVAAIATIAAITPIAPPTYDPFKSVAPLVGMRTFRRKNGTQCIQIQAHIPDDTPLSTTGADYIFSLDVSGSMDTVAWVEVDKGSVGLSRLALVKHLVKTIVAVLGPKDRVALVAFNDRARPILDLTPMTEAGRTLLSRELDQLVAEGSTHLYGGVEEAARLASSETCRGRRIVGMILTDGVPTESIHPVTGGRSTMSVIQERIHVTNPWSFHAIGFSSNINSCLLERLANWAPLKGRMLFVPSGDMVSTNGINWTAHDKTIVSLGAVINYTVNGLRYTVTTGPLAVGQRRDFVVEIPPDATVILERDSTLGDLGSTEVADCRSEFVTALTHVIDTTMLKSMGYITPELQAELFGALMAFHGHHAASAEPLVQAMLRDVVSRMDGEGQCRLALQHLGSGAWGLPYLRAYRDHMRDGVCMNFKDPGLKTFETPPFLEFQRQGDAAFAAIPPPPFQREGDVAPTTNIGRAFNNASGGCFEGSMPVRMESVSEGTKAIRDIRRGDQVWTPSGPATVDYALELNIYAPSQPMVQLTSRIAVTPWHPCRSLDGPWTFPSSLVQYAARPIQTVYNLVLDRGHVIESTGGPAATYQFVTLGHGFQESPLRHALFGSRERILDALRKQPGFEEGRPVYRNLVAVQDSATGLIVDWIDQV